MATDKRMNHCKRCQKATLHIGRGTSHLLHLVLSLMTFGVWTLVWISMAFLHGADSQCTECGRNRRAPLTTLAIALMAVVLPSVWYASNKDKSLAGVESETGATQSASAHSPEPNPDGVPRWVPRSAPDPDGVLPAAGQSTDKGQSICYGVQSAVNGLADYTQTACLPTGGKTGALSFIVISSEPVFSVEASKKGWVLVVVGAIGQTLNAQPSVKAGELWLSDTNQMKGGVAHVLPVSVAKSLQRQVYNGQIDIEGMYAEIKRNLVRKTIAK